MAPPKEVKTYKISSSFNFLSSDFPKLVKVTPKRKKNEPETNGENFQNKKSYPPLGKKKKQHEPEKKRRKFLK
jgi:hypothetical protein